jgi:hypothetical protein
MTGSTTLIVLSSLNVSGLLCFLNRCAGMVRIGEEVDRHNSMKILSGTALTLPGVSYVKYQSNGSHDILWTIFISPCNPH